MATKTFCDSCGADLVEGAGCYLFGLDLRKLDGPYDESIAEASVYVQPSDLCGRCAALIRKALRAIDFVHKRNCPPRPPMVETGREARRGC